MESELGVVLREQQALLSLLLNRVALVDGAQSQSALGAYAGALWAHLSMWRSVLLPAAADSPLVRQVVATGSDAVRVLSGVQLGQQCLGGRPGIQALVKSLLALLAQEDMLLRTTFSALPVIAQTVLAERSDQEFIRLIGLSELDASRQEHVEYA